MDHDGNFYRWVRDTNRNDAIAFFPGTGSSTVPATIIMDERTQLFCKLSNTTLHLISGP